MSRQKNQKANFPQFRSAEKQRLSNVRLFIHIWGYMLFLQRLVLWPVLRRAMDCTFVDNIEEVYQRIQIFSIDAEVGLETG